MNKNKSKIRILCNFICIAFVVLNITYKSYAQTHLDLQKNIGGALKGYYDSVFSLLYNGFTDKPYARYAVIPSFGNEYAFSVEHNSDGYYIISNSLPESYWYSKEKKNVQIITHTYKIDTLLYLSIGKLFNIVAEQTQKDENENMGLDGVPYYFSTSKNGDIVVGQIWSPERKTLMYRLVTICQNLYMLPIKKNKPSQIKIRKDINRWHC